VLELRRDRMATVRRVIEGLTDESLDRHTEPVEAPGWRAALRRLWGGRLCVTRLQRSYAELQRIQDELDGAVGRSLGVEVLRTGLVDNENAVHLEVVVLDEEAREVIRRRYGDAVRVTAKLTAVP
jgi:hypothetical protein